MHASFSKQVLVHNHSNGNELRILMQIKLISLTIVEYQDSLDPHFETETNSNSEMAHSRQLCKPETQSRVCVFVSNSPNSPECLYEAMETREKSSVSFIKYFSKIIRPITGETSYNTNHSFLLNCAFYLVLKTDCPIVSTFVVSR